MNLWFVLMILGCLLSTVQLFSTGQILLENITEDYNSNDKPTQELIVQPTEGSNVQAQKLNAGCRVDQVKCYNSERCISATRVCDKIKDCTDNSDETDCYRRLSPTTTSRRPLFLNCSYGYTRCYDNSRCVPLLWICDGGVPDCPDKSDEIDCYRKPNPATTTTTPYLTITQQILNCIPGYTSCYDNSKCIPLHYICDGAPDCFDFSDERDCGRRPTSSTISTTAPACSSGQMMCLDNSRCIPVTLICNNNQDCADNSDERFCYCGLGKLSCLDGSRCIPVTSICNNVQDCIDFSDERYCPQISSATTRTTTATPLNCSSGFTRCYNNSKCIPLDWICDGGSPDCPDGSDEIDCYRRSTTSASMMTTTKQTLSCGPDETMCYDNSRCVPLRWICDGDRDCIDNSDEIDCHRRPSTTSTPSTPFNYNEYSDRQSSTSTSSTRTTTNQILTCLSEQTKCYDDSLCIPLRWICDGGSPDCPDGSDEIDCYRRPTATTSPTTTMRSTGCGSGQVKCYISTQCIPNDWICDGIRDCPDNSDEIDCFRKPNNNIRDGDRQTLTTPEPQTVPPTEATEHP